MTHNFNPTPNIGQDGQTAPSRAMLIAGKDGSGNLQDILVGTDGKLQVDATVSVSSSGSAIEDGVDSNIKATVIESTDEPGTFGLVAVNPDGSTITGGGAGGSGTEYTEGDTDASITGQAILWEDTSDTLRAVSAAKPLPVVQTGTPGLPTGAATSAKQDTGNTSLASIDTKTPALGQALAAGSVPVVLTASQLTTLTPPAAITGFATSTKQSDGSQKTQVVDGSGNVIGATSNALDINIKSGNITGFATSAKQDTGNTSLSSIDGKLVTAKTADYDTGAGTDTVQMVGLALPASGGAVAGGTSTNPIQVSLANTSTNSTAVKVDGSAVTQPVSWSGQTVTVTQGTATNLKTQAEAYQGGSAVSSSNPLQVTLANGSVPSHAVTNAGTFAVQDSEKVADNAGFTDGTTKVLPAGYIYDEVAGTALTENDAAAARINVNRAQVHAIEDGATRGRYATVTASNAVKVDGSAVAQPVTDNSGSLTVDAPVGTPVFVRLSDGSSAITTLAVSLASVPSHAVTNDGTFAVQDSQVVADNAGFTDGTTKVQPAGYIYDEVAGTALTENDAAAARINVNRAQIHAIEDGTTRGRYATVTASNALKVDASGVAVPVTDNSGSLTVDAPLATPVFTTSTPNTTGGWSVSSQTALSNSKTSVKGSSGNFGGYMFYNPNSSAVYIQVWDVASASVTVGTTAPTYVIPLPATAAANVEFSNGINHATAITVAATTTATGSTAPGTALTGFFLYK